MATVGSREWAMGGGELDGKRSDSKEAERKKKTLRWFNLRKEYTYSIQTSMLRKKHQAQSCDKKSCLWSIVPGFN